jgi:RHS repeat-associated protein
MNEAKSFYIYGADGGVIYNEDGIDTSRLALHSYIKDIRGSSRTLLDDTSNVAALYKYDDFGKTTVERGRLLGNELLYTGAVYDRFTDQYYLNARYYNPADGNFLTQDTYRGDEYSLETWNLYRYCAGDPINNIDLNGHFPLKIVDRLASH